MVPVTLPDALIEYTFQSDLVHERNSNEQQRFMLKMLQNRTASA